MEFFGEDFFSYQEATGDHKGKGHGKYGKRENWKMVQEEGGVGVRAGALAVAKMRTGPKGKPQRAEWS